MRRRKKGFIFHRAGDRIRTGDVQLGRLTLYQLSYSRALTDENGMQTMCTTEEEASDAKKNGLKTSEAKLKMPPGEMSAAWWRVMDSNHRRHSRQIYSLLPLATRATLQDVGTGPCCA